MQRNDPKYILHSLEARSHRAECMTIGLKLKHSILIPGYYENAFDNA